MAKTLFATHYWELTKLEEKIPGAVNYNVAVHEAEDHITFLRKIVKGGTDKSYGIHVARLAGLPPESFNDPKKFLNILRKIPIAKVPLSQLELNVPILRNPKPSRTNCNCPFLISYNDASFRKKIMRCKQFIINVL